MLVQSLQYDKVCTLYSVFDNHEDCMHTRYTVYELLPLMFDVECGGILNSAAQQHPIIMQKTGDETRLQSAICEEASCRAEPCVPDSR